MLTSRQIFRYAVPARTATKKALMYRFMRNPLLRRQLVQRGLVTRDGHVRCTLPELNRYRDYLHRCYQRKMYYKKVSNPLVTRRYLTASLLPA